MTTTEVFYLALLVTLPILSAVFFFWLTRSFFGSRENPKNGGETASNKQSSEGSLSEKKTSNLLFDHGIVLFGLLFKLLKTANVIKAGLLGMSLAGWSLLFSWQFAVVIIAVIMFHEYGHVCAMKRHSIPTKGMYLIPFVGGVAIGDKPRSQWQDVYISMMGPVFGLGMTMVFYLAYILTGNHFSGLVASFSGLINVFNLLPIYPLDGGRVLKSMTTSASKKGGLLFLLTFSILIFFISRYYGLTFLSFLIFIGFIDLAANLKRSTKEDQVPLTSYGIAFSMAWYVGTVLAFLLIIYWIAQSGVPGSEIVTEILES